MDKIKILNPAHPGGSITSLKRAERYVRRGVAKWTSTDSITFIETDHRFVSAKIMASTVDRAGQQHWYDKEGPMSYEDLRGLPFAGLTIERYSQLMSRKMTAREAYRERKMDSPRIGRWPKKAKQRYLAARGPAIKTPNPDSSDGIAR